MSSTSGSNSLTVRRDARQRDLVPPERLAETSGLVTGIGAVGRQVALQLAALGLPRLMLVDHDTVEPENLAPQGYWPEDLGRPKVEATAAVCGRINPAAEITTMPERFGRARARYFRGWAAFVCVDRISARKLIWEALRPIAAFWVDARMSAEVVRVLAAGEPATDRHYATTLFRAGEAYAGSCTAKSTIYTANIAAGLMLAQFTRWLRGLPVDPDLTLNLLAGELTAASPAG
jgi:sulfur carrier protein ThiS adenylyltransferase